MKKIFPLVLGSIGSGLTIGIVMFVEGYERSHSYFGPSRLLISSLIDVAIYSILYFFLLLITVFLVRKVKLLTPSYISYSIVGLCVTTISVLVSVLAMGKPKNLEHIMLLYGSAGIIGSLILHKLSKNN